MKLTRREFYERCFYAVDEENLVAQMALLVQLYWSAKQHQDRWELFVSTCSACGTVVDGVEKIALTRLTQGRE